MLTRDVNLSVLTVIYRIKSALSSAGFSSANFAVKEVEPYLPSTAFVCPIITVEADPVMYRPFEMGAPNILSPLFFIDIYAMTNHQRDDIADIICVDLDVNSIPLYDFNTGFPTAIGSYSGITQTGRILFQSPVVQNVAPSPSDIGKIYQHHKLIMIRGDILKT